MRRMARESLRARAEEERVSREAIWSSVGGAAVVASSSLSSSEAGPMGMPLARRRFSAASRDFFSSQSNSHGYFSSK